MLHKSFEPLDTKVDAETGTFEATVAVFNNVDKGGDRIIPGAFEKTLAAWKASGDPIPVIFNHDWATPDAHIGVVEDAAETTKGLWVKGRLDVADNPVARQVHRLMQRRSLKEFSFGYEVPAGGQKRAKDGANDLTELVLAEVGPTLKGMNPSTELHAVKSAVFEHELQAQITALQARVDGLEQQLKAGKTEDASEQPEKKAAQVDPLEQKARGLVMELLAEGSTPPARVTKENEQSRPEMDAGELKRRSRDLMLQVLTGT